MSIVIGDWRIRQADPHNLVTEHYHVASSNNRKGGTAPKWHLTGNYFQSVRSAIAFVRRQAAKDAVLDDRAVVAADEFLRRLEELDAGIEEAISKLV